MRDNRRMRSLKTVMLVAAMALSGCSAPMALPGQAGQAVRSGFDQPVEVAVTRDGDRWTAEFRFGRDVPVWAFTRSALLRETRQPWRLQQWTVETPGVVLERQGTRDILRATGGGPVPRTVRIAMQPEEVNVEASYDPALIFSDGSVALYSEQFNVFALPSVEAARAVPGDLNGIDLDGGPSRVTWADAAGPVLFKGEWRASAVAEDAHTYVLFGRARQTETARMTTVIDPALPTWISEELSAFAPRVADLYEDRLGPGQTDRPTVMVNWSGPTQDMTSMIGSVLPGLIVMSFDGAGILQPTEEMRTVSRWFIAHESAHFWLGQTLRYEFARDMWITEGGADLMAVRALQAIDPAYDARAELQKEVDDCIDLSRGRGVASAGERGEHRAYYACGAVFAMAAEGAQRQRDGSDWFGFLAPLMAANQVDGVLTREEWLDALTQVSRDPSLRLDIERMLNDGVTDPAAIIARLFERTGVAYRLEGTRLMLT